MPVPGQLWLELAGGRAGFYSVGLCLSVSLSFCCDLFFKGHVLQFGPSSWHHVCVGIEAYLGLPAHHSLGRELVRKSRAQQLCMEDGPSLQGLIQHQGAGGSFKATARVCLLLPVLLNQAVPICVI